MFWINLYYASQHTHFVYLPFLTYIGTSAAAWSGVMWVGCQKVAHDFYESTESDDAWTRHIK